MGYKLIDKISSGRTTEVFLAAAQGEHHFEKHVAIKRLLPHLAHDEHQRALLAEEAKLGAQLVHPKIVQVFELGRLGELLYIAMEHVDGLDLATVVRQLVIAQRKVDPYLAVWIAHEILDALDYAHNLMDDERQPLGIVHRDVSPANVLLSRRGDIKLIDFAIARSFSQLHADGTPGLPSSKTVYMSPEQVSLQSLDARSDVFSAGVVLAELLTGRRLFAAESDLDVLLMVRDANIERFEMYGADLDPNLAAIVRKALRKSVTERWQSAAELRDALDEWTFLQRKRMTANHVARFLDELLKPTEHASELTRPVIAVARTVTPAIPAVSRTIMAPPPGPLPSISIPPARAGETRPAAGTRPAATRPAPPPAPTPRAPTAPPTTPKPVAAAKPATNAPRPGVFDDRPRQSTRGRLHAARIKPVAGAIAPYAPRDRIGSSESQPVPPIDTAVVDDSDGVVTEIAGDTISKAVSVFVKEPDRRER